MAEYIEVIDPEEQFAGAKNLGAKIDKKYLRDVASTGNVSTEKRNIGQDDVEENVIPLGLFDTILVELGIKKLS